MKPHWAIICMASSCQFLFLSCVPSVRIILENSLQLYLCNFPHVTWVTFYVSILSLFTRHLGHFSHVTFQPPIPELCSWCQNSPRELFQLFANPLCLPLTEPFIGNILLNGPFVSLLSSSSLIWQNLFFSSAPKIYLSCCDLMLNKEDLLPDYPALKMESNIITMSSVPFPRPTHILTYINQEKIKTKYQLMRNFIEAGA